MNIGIFTWFNDDRNCGQTLQAYALERVLEKEYSAKVVLINYKYLYLKQLYKNQIMFNARSIHINIQKRTLLRQFVFDWFVLRKMNSSKLLFSKKDVEKFLKKNNIKNLMLGSDQLWNPETGEIPDVMLFKLDCENLHKFSYSPSMCTEKSKEKYTVEIKKIAQSIEDFDFIGVRESSAKRILKEYQIEKEIFVLLDPVFLLSDIDWISDLNIKSAEEEYILIYCLGMITEEMFQYIEKIQQEKKCERIYYICTDEKYDVPSKWSKIRNVGPRKFVELIYNATYVLGDSFHMVCFSVVFRKNFICFKGKRQTFIPNADRIIDLLESVGLENRLVDNDNVHLDINYCHEIENKIIGRINYSKQKLGEMIEIMKKYE